MADVESARPEVPLVNVQIDGDWHQFPKGMRIIEACRLAGKEVPHYCYHPKLTSPGNCRMCLVEMGMPAHSRAGEELHRDGAGHLPIHWSPRPVIACANVVAEGMGIRTDSPLTKSCREGVMEFLLINHPLDCPICDQAGECRLQEFSVEHGKGGARFREEKVRKPKNVDVGPRIRLDDERCILCSRCIRFMEEVAEDPVLGFTERGSFTTLSVHPGRELDSNYSLNTVDICPVGALTSNDFRFAMRVWFLKETKSIDVNCGTGINIVIHSRERKIYRITPRENNEVNSCWMPDSHRLNFHYVDSAARLTEPMIKEGDGHVPVGWREALARAAERVAKVGGDHLAIVASARMTNEELFLVRLLARQLGIRRVDVVPRMGESDGLLISADRNPNSLGAKLVLGVERPGEVLAGLREELRSGRVRGLLVFGEDLAEAGFDREETGAAGVLLASHILANPTADAAEVVLPGAAWAEKRGSMINVQGRLQRLNRAVTPPGLARDDWELLAELIRATGGAAPWQGIDDVFRDMASEVAEMAGLSLARIGDFGVPLVNTGVSIPLLQRETERRAKGLIVG
jgi:NADH-quinone oxidoreductase subunit G